MVDPSPADVEAAVVDRELEAYLAARDAAAAKDEQTRFAGRWVARRKCDAVVVAAGDDYDELERRLDSDGIDPESVVLGLVPPPGNVQVV